jgi:multidrug efflux pump subunit AcrA (membrane-fusion protein)
MKLYTLFFPVLFLFSFCTNNEEKILPEERELVESVYSSVTIQPDSLYELHSIVSGIVDHIFVEEGELVSKDQPLIQIINNTPKLNTKNAELSLQLAKENYSGKSAILKNIKDEIASATLNYKHDSINYFRQKNLWEQKIGSKVEYDAKKLQYQISENNLNLLKSRFAQTENELRTALEQTKNNYKASLINTKDFTVKSKISGKMYAIYKEPGELIRTQEPLGSVGSSTRFVIEMLVDEVDIVQIVINMDVVIKLDAYKEEVFQGKVSKIYPKKDERNQTFTVEAIFKDPPKVLYPGLSGEANIIIAKKKNALTIPRDYLIQGTKVKTNVGLIEVELGLENMEFVEILSGIDKNTYIYKE